jgi:hypothetical protein
MPDRSGLGLIGLVFGAITSMVAATGLFVVQSHLDGRLTLDDGRHPGASASFLNARAVQ